MTQESRLEKTKEPRTILLAEADPIVLAALERALASERFKVFTAANTGEALHQVRHGEVDAALVDISPNNKENAWETFCLLSELHPLMPIVVMSANPESRPPRAIRLPDARFEKPLLNLPLLFETLRKLTSPPTPQYSHW